MPGKPFWNTETADAACGGNPWAGTFLDTFRYLDQLGRLARQEVTVVIHNTLVASDYGLLDENTFEPKPNYWGALLWRRFMGTTVLDPGVKNGPGLHVYAQCLRGTPGGVAVLAINTDKTAPHALTIPIAGQRYTLSSDRLDGTARAAERKATGARRGRRDTRIRGRRDCCWHRDAGADNHHVCDASCRWKRRLSVTRWMRR